MKDGSQQRCPKACCTAQSRGQCVTEDEMKNSSPRRSSDDLLLIYFDRESGDPPREVTAGRAGHQRIRGLVPWSRRAVGMVGDIAFSRLALDKEREGRQPDAVECHADQIAGPPSAESARVVLTDRRGEARWRVRSTSVSIASRWSSEDQRLSWVNGSSRYPILARKRWMGW